MSYHRAVWLEENREEEGVLPSAWVRGKVVMWPPSKMSAFKLMKEGVEPNENWRLLKLIKIKITSDCYEDCNNYDLTTETEEDNQQVSKKRKRTACITFFEGEEEVDVDINTEIKLSTFPQPPAELGKMLPSNISLYKKVVDVVPQGYKSDHATKLSPIPQSPGCSSCYSKIPSFKSSMVTIPKENKMDQSTNQSALSPFLLPRKFDSKIPIFRQRAATSKDNVIDRSMKLSALNRKFQANMILSEPTAPQENEIDNGKFQRKVLYQLSNMANEIKDLRIAVEMMAVPSLETVAEVHLEVIAGAIGTLNGYRKLEEQCGVLANRTILLRLLSRIGGSSIKDTSKNLLKRLFTNFVMSHLSMDGKGSLKKLPFRDSALCQLVVECVLKRYSTSSLSEIHSCIGSHFRMAPFRLGGTGKGGAHFSNSQDGEAGLNDSSKDDAYCHGSDHDNDKYDIIIIKISVNMYKTCMYEKKYLYV
ncbi:uncharacterized protein LOC124812375 isoform X2 [Hydra vulgaris]|uniref:uncharacterized protein LOC100212178 isoform X2 n=1 Tax=Hydra vulgaris TaxID=6087 RepID=UPI001F5FC9AE|nr:uncharacterized protein LOC100212178 isoform X2 [Hydra vulgaris]XP_047134875.1 uncharacterized protein LOC124812375 isoform X2 [Hydra vulgaris]